MSRVRCFHLNFFLSFNPLYYTTSSTPPLVTTLSNGHANGAQPTLSDPINHSQNQDRWVQLSIGTTRSFAFNRDGFVGLSMNKSTSTDNGGNNTIPSSQWVGIDAIEFVYTLTSGNVITSAVSPSTWEYYTITSKSTDTQLKVDLTGLSANADLYVRNGSQPTTTSYSCRQINSGTNSESCTLVNSGINTWYIGVYYPNSTATTNASYTLQATLTERTAATTYPLSVKTTGIGSVTSNLSGINNCGNGSTCSANFAANSSVTLTVASGYQGSNWTGCTSSNSTSCTVNMGTAAKNVIVTLSAISTDKINPTATISSIKTAYTVGDWIEYRFVASDNKELEFLEFVIKDANQVEKYKRVFGVHGTSQDTGGYGISTVGWATGIYSYTYTVTDVAQNKSAYTGTFTIASVAPANYQLSVKTTGVGSLTSNIGGINCGNGSTCNANFAANSTVTLTVASGYQGSNWTGCTSSNSTSCTVNMGTAAKSVTVTLSAIPISYSLLSTSTTTGGGTWGSILKLTGSLSGSTLTLTASKASGTFSSPGTIYFKVGSYETYGADRSTVSVAAGTTSKSYIHDLSTYTGYPKDFYVRFESSGGGYAWVGPIRVTQTQ